MLDNILMQFDTRPEKGDELADFKSSDKKAIDKNFLGLGNCFSPGVIYCAKHRGPPTMGEEREALTLF